MCRLVVWVGPENTHRDHAVNAQQFKRGMVVDILEDGTHPGTEVLALGWWRVIDVLGAAKSEYEHLLSSDPEFIESAIFASRPHFPRRRVHVLDLAGIDSHTALSKEAVSARLTAHLPIRNPDVIGYDPEILGDH